MTLRAKDVNYQPGAYEEEEEKTPISPVGPYAEGLEPTEDEPTEVLDYAPVQTGFAEDKKLPFEDPVESGFEYDPTSVVQSHDYLGAALQAVNEVENEYSALTNYYNSMMGERQEIADEETKTVEGLQKVRESEQEWQAEIKLQQLNREKDLKAQELAIQKEFNSDWQKLQDTLTDIESKPLSPQTLSHKTRAYWGAQIALIGGIIAQSLKGGGPNPNAQVAETIIDRADKAVELELKERDRQARGLQRKQTTMRMGFEDEKLTLGMAQYDVRMELEKALTASVARLQGAEAKAAGEQALIQIKQRNLDFKTNLGTEAQKIGLQHKKDQSGQKLAVAKMYAAQVKGYQVANPELFGEAKVEMTNPQKQEFTMKATASADIMHDYAIVEKHLPKVGTGQKFLNLIKTGDKDAKIVAGAMARIIINRAIATGRGANFTAMEQQFIYLSQGNPLAVTDALLGYTNDELSRMEEGKTSIRASLVNSMKLYGIPAGPKLKQYLSGHTADKSGGTRKPF